MLTRAGSAAVEDLLGEFSIVKTAARQRFYVTSVVTRNPLGGCTLQPGDGFRRRKTGTKLLCSHTLSTRTVLIAEYETGA